MKLLRQRQWKLEDIEKCTIDASVLGNEGIMTKDVVATLYQSGYITIKVYDKDFNQYILGYPNGEVEESFIKFLRPILLGDESRNS